LKIAPLTTLPQSDILYPMQLIKASLIHRAVAPRAGGSGPHPTLIMLHGRGADENDLLGLTPHLDERLLIISARAPYPFGGDFGGYAWYDIEEIGTPKPEAFKHSLGLLKRFIGEVAAGYPADPTRLYLMGFSMGTVMSYAAALAEPQMVSGVVAHSGYVPEVPGVTFKPEDLGGKCFFIAHGTYDRIIPVGLGRAARDLLAGTPAEVIYKEYPMDHQISEESLRDLANWLQERL